MLLSLLLLSLCIVRVRADDLSIELALVNDGVYPALDGTVTTSSYNCSSPPIKCCSGDTVVCQLDFSAYNLSGTIPHILSALTRLTTLRVADNPNLHGMLPTVWPPVLRYLHVDGCALNGTVTLPQALYTFDGHNNEFTSMPSTFPASLREFYIYSQRAELRGRIPSLALNQYLSKLNVAGNAALTGTLPPLPGSLNHLYIYATSISGTLPPLPNGLVNLGASNSLLVCTLPPTLPSALYTLQLDNTACYGTIPSSLPGNMYALILSNAHFSGTLPLSLPASLSALIVDGNELHGSVFYPNHTFVILRVKRNRFSGYFNAFSSYICDVYTQNASLEGNCFTCPTSYSTGACLACAGNTSLIGECVPYTLAPTASPTPPPTPTPTLAPSPVPTTLAPTLAPTVTTTTTAAAAAAAKKGEAAGDATTLIIVGVAVGFFCISLLVIGLVALLLRNLRAERRRRRKPASTSASNKQRSAAVSGASASSTVFAGGRVSSHAASRNRSRRASGHLSAHLGASAGTNYAPLNPVFSQYRPMATATATATATPAHAYENGPMRMLDGGHEQHYDLMDTMASVEVPSSAQASVESADGYGQPPEDIDDGAGTQIFAYGNVE